DLAGAGGGVVQAEQRAQRPARAAQVGVGDVVGQVNRGSVDQRRRIGGAARGSLGGIAEADVDHAVGLLGDVDVGVLREVVEQLVALVEQGVGVQSTGLGRSDLLVEHGDLIGV